MNNTSISAEISSSFTSGSVSFTRSGSSVTAEGKVCVGPNGDTTAGGVQVDAHSMACVGLGSNGLTATVESTVSGGNGVTAGCTHTLDLFGGGSSLVCEVSETVSFGLKGAGNGVEFSLSNGISHEFGAPDSSADSSSDTTPGLGLDYDFGADCPDCVRGNEFGSGFGSDASSFDFGGNSNSGFDGGGFDGGGECGADMCCA